MFLLRGELGHSASVSSDDEDRVVAEPGLPARRFRYLAVNLTVEELDVEAVKDLAILAELAGIRRAEKDGMAIQSLAAHASMVALTGSRRTARRNRQGAHQFARPRSLIVAGTTRARTSVASSATAIARPRPTDLMMTTSASGKAMNTPTMIAAAPVIRRPLRSRPLATAAVLFPVRKYSS